MNEATQIVDRLRKLKAEHERITGERTGAAPGFMEDESVVRHSYRLVAEDALQDGILTEETLQGAGLPKALERA